MNELERSLYEALEDAEKTINSLYMAINPHANYDGVRNRMADRDGGMMSVRAALSQARVAR